MQISQHTG